MYHYDPYYLIAKRFADGTTRYINEVDIYWSGTRKRVWTERASGAHRFKERVEAQIVAEMFFDKRDKNVTVIEWPRYPYPYGLMHTPM